jgi:membrane protease YdiL (CAAX protease family)
MRLVNAPTLGVSRETHDTIVSHSVPIGVPFWSGLAAVVVAMFVGFAAAMLTAIVIALIIGETPDFTAGHITNTVITYAFYGASGAFGWWALSTMQTDVLHGLARRDLRVAVVGIGIVFAARIIGGLILVAVNLGNHVQAGFEKFSLTTPQPSTTALAAIAAFISLVIIGPIVEEVVFRGLLFGALSRPLGVAFGAVVSGLIFGALHGDWVFFPFIAALGIVNAVVYARTHNLAVPIVVHAANNLLASLFLIPLALHGN